MTDSEVTSITSTHHSFHPSKSVDDFDAPGQEGPSHKIGTFMGVFCPSFVNIVNIVYYVRLPYVIGTAGGLQTIIGLAVSFILVLITLTSLSAISTNGEIEAGGPYFLISRTLGPTFGGSSGICLALASLLGAATAHLGLAEAIVGFYEPKSVVGKDFLLVKYSSYACFVITNPCWTGTPNSLTRAKFVAALPLTISTASQEPNVSLIFARSFVETTRGSIMYTSEIF